MNANNPEPPRSERQLASALVRTLATSVIRTNRDLWDDLKGHLGAGHDVAIFGSLVHLQIPAAVDRAVARLEESQRLLMETHVDRPANAYKGWTYKDAITGEIFVRASRVATRW